MFLLKKCCPTDTSTLLHEIDKTVTKTVEGFVSKGTGNYFKGKSIYIKTRQIHLEKITKYDCLIELSF